MSARPCYFCGDSIATKSFMLGGIYRDACKKLGDPGHTPTDPPFEFKASSEATLQRDLAAKAPPTAKKVAAVDFDSTIFPWGPLLDLAPPFEGVPAAMRKLKEAGYTIVIFTSRASSHWWEKEHERFGFDNAKLFGNVNLSYVMQKLNEFDIPFDQITAEKVPAEVYFDDKAIRIGPEYPLDTAIGEFLAW